MLPSESPFPCKWWGTGLESAGLEDVRPNVGTYGRYEFDQLPPLPIEMHGDFAWLATAAKCERNIATERASENAKSIQLLHESSARIGLKLPQPFTLFMATAQLHERIRSNTDCFLDVCSAPIRSPAGDGWLVRFLADSQGCLFWYLYQTLDGSDHAVVSSPGFYGTDAEQWQVEPTDPKDLVFSAESFEAFMCRFWIENEIWYAEWEHTAMPDFAREYIGRYRQSRSNPPNAR